MHSFGQNDTIFMRETQLSKEVTVIRVGGGLLPELVHTRLWSERTANETCPNMTPPPRRALSMLLTPQGSMFNGKQSV